MYYLLYGILYLISLLPTFILYGLSNVAAFCLHKIFRYRIKVIEEGISYALPKQNDTERKEIVRQFYRNFTASFTETILLLSMSEATFKRRATMDVEGILEVLDKDKRAIVLASHLFGWEYGNSAIVGKISVPFAGVYMTVQNAAFEKLMLHIRRRFGALLVSVHDFPKEVHVLDEKKVVWGLMADQRPPLVSGAFWLNFFGRPAPFSAAPEKIAQRLNADVFFILPKKIRRGFYHFDCVKICENAAATERGDITKMYRDTLEQAIREQPANYLWSHKRWKRNFEKPFVRKWIEDAPAPSTT